MRRHAILRVAFTSALSFALVAAPLHSVSAAPIAGATKKPLPPPETAPTDTATPPTDTPPTDTPPTDTPPSDTPPTDTPPTDTPPADTPPTDTPPADAPPADTPPADENQPPPPEPAPDPYADRPEEPRVGGKPRKGKGLIIAGASVLGAGIAATIAFGLMTRHCSYSGPLECRLQDQDGLLIPLGSAATLLGAMLLAVGIGYHVQYKRWEQWKPGDNEKKKKRRGKGNKTALVPGMWRGGGGLVWTGRF